MYEFHIFYSCYWIFFLSGETAASSVRVNLETNKTIFYIRSLTLLNIYEYLPGYTEKSKYEDS